MRSCLRLIRDRFHPLHRLRRNELLRPLLRRCDVALWMRMPHVHWKVRARALRHASALLLNGGTEPEINALFRVLSRRVPIQSFWDIGSNFGYYGWMVKSLLPNVDIRMFEPDPDNATLIRETSRRAGLSAITVREVVVSDMNGSRSFLRDQVSGLTGSIADGSATFVETHFRLRGDPIRVDAVSVDQERAAAAPVDLVKIDVEGHEEAVFRGATATLEKDQPIVIFECFHGGGQIAHMLHDLGYQVADAERMTDDLTVTTNFLGLPRRHRALFDSIRRDWSDELARLK